MPVDVVRDAAIDVLLRVFVRDAHLDVALDRTLRRRKLKERGRRFLTQLVYGTVRHARLCDHVLDGLLHQPKEDLPDVILIILRMGVFQALFCNQVTFPAMVHTSVDLAKKRGHAGTARLANAVLKKAPQRIEDAALPEPETDLCAHLGVRYSLPDWLVHDWVVRHGEEKARSMCAACDTQADTAIRVNTLKASVESVTADLEKAGCGVEKRTAVPEELTLVKGSQPVGLKRFQEGHFIIQDPASMAVAHAVEPKPGERVLDLCAAPGGKTTHMAALAEGKALVAAMDQYPNKLGRVRDNLERLGTPGVRLICGDGLHPPCAPGFDRVLVDAPCTGLGTLRRHPDLKWRVGPEDPARMAVVQQALLREAIRLCKNSGVVVYSVCTITSQETEAVVAPVIEEGLVAAEDGPEWLNEWRIAQGRYLILPGDGGLDGFFLTRLRKQS